MNGTTNGFTFIDALVERVRVLEAALVQRPTTSHFLLVINEDIESCIHKGIFDTLEAAQDYARAELGLSAARTEIEQWEGQNMVNKWVQARPANQTWRWFEK